MAELSAQNFMSEHLVSVLWSADLQSSFEKMKSRNFRHLPVVSENNEVVGIISDRDFQRAMQIDEADYFSSRVACASFDPQAKVRDYMCWPVQTISEECSIVEVAHMMIAKKISAVLVSRQSTIIGILTTEDMLRALIENLESKSSHPVQERLTSMFFNSPARGLADLAGQTGI